MKKKILTVLFSTVFASAVFSIDLSAGIGADYSFTEKIASFKMDGEYLKTEERGHYIGLKAFFDIQYAAVIFGIDFLAGGIKLKNSKSSRNFLHSISVTDRKIGMTDLYLSLLLKYPVTFPEAKIYPLLGFEFNFNIYAKYNGTDIKSKMSTEIKKNLNRHYFVLGTGYDIYLIGNLFLKNSILLGFQMYKTPQQAKTNPYLPQDISYTPVGIKLGIGLALGYEFH